MKKNTNHLLGVFLIVLAICSVQEIVRSQEGSQPREEVAKPLPRGRTFVPYGVGEAPTTTGKTSSPKTINSQTQTLTTDNSTSILDTPTATPVTFSSLTAGVNNELQVLSVQEAAQFQIPALLSNVDAKSTRKILVKNFIAYNETTATNGDRIHTGAGIRWVMDVATSDATAKLSFPVLAAQAQLGTARASVKIYTIGINNDEINAAANVPTELNVENYFKMVQGFDKAVSLIKGTLQVSPQVVEIISEVKDGTDADYTKSILQSWTLARIAEKKSVKDAQDSCPISDAAAKSTIAEIYRLRTGITDPLAHPTEVDAARAKQLLSGIKVK